VRAVDCDDVFIQRGSRGRVLTPLGIGLPFVVDAFEPKTFWGWRVAGIPATGHRVDPITPHGCRLTFSVPAWAVAYLPVCYLALVRIQRLLSQLDQKDRR